MKRRKKSTPTIQAEQPNQQSVEEEDEKIRVSISDLPIETLMDIHSRLSVKSIFRCRSVCKLWLQILLTPYFAKLHFSRAPTCPLLRNRDAESISKTLYLVEFERDNPCHVCENENRPRKKSCTKKGHGSHVNMKISTRFTLPNVKVMFRECDFKVVNSCNGLLCLHGYSYKDPVVIYNPVTGEYCVVPSPWKDEFTRELTVGGLGFCPKTKQYKVLVLMDKRFPKMDTGWHLEINVAFVYTLGLRTWRTIGKAPGTLSELSSPAYLNGALHWFLGAYTPRTSIIYFDFDSELFHIMPPPDDLVITSMTLSSWGAGMGTLRGQICICDNSSIGSIRVWVMNNDSAEKSWSRMFQIDTHGSIELPHGLYKPIDFLKDDLFLMYHTNNTVISYDGHDSRLRCFKIRPFRSKFQVIPHIPSFISLKEVLGDNMEVSNVRARLASSEGKIKPLLLVEDNTSRF